MKNLFPIVWKVFSRGGGWLPVLVLAIHIIFRSLGFYGVWPAMDMPVHFAGGFAIAYLVSKSFRLLPRTNPKSNRIIWLELVLMITFTATAATFWEFAEFTTDYVFGSNIQVSLANTMSDMAMGILGACLLASIRIKQTRVEGGTLLEMTNEWLTGETPA